jgi:hypothetical protein
VRTRHVVIATLSLDQDLRFFQRAEDLSVQQFVAQLAVEALHVAVIPRAARLNEQLLHDAEDSRNRWHNFGDNRSRRRTSECDTVCYGRP